MQPSNALSCVRRLAADESLCEFYRPVLGELRKHGLDSDDLREIIQTELGETHCFKSEPTEKYYPATQSDYYSLWVADCSATMFLKLLVVEPDTSRERLVVTSFKKDDRYE